MAPGENEFDTPALEQFPQVQQSGKLLCKAASEVKQFFTLDLESTNKIYRL